jgi:hypothetical protein
MLYYWNVDEQLYIFLKRILFEMLWVVLANDSDSAYANVVQSSSVSFTISLDSNAKDTEEDCTTLA